jgi:FkbH-like protein
VTHRLPAPNDFGNALKSAASMAQGENDYSALASLAQCDLTYLQAIQFDQVLRQIDPDVLPNYVSLRLAVLSSSTVTHLLPAIRVAGFDRRLIFELYETPFGQYRQELLDPDSSLSRFQPQFLLFSFSARDPLSRVEITASRESVEALVAHYVDELTSLWRAAKNYQGVTLVQQTFLNIAEPVFGSLDRTLASSPSRVIRLLNERLVDAAASQGVLVLDLERALERDGIDFWHDNARWLQAKMEISPAAAVRYGDLFARIAASQRGLSKKCLVLDLDNTLWGGVVGDDGIDNIVLGAGNALGEAYSAFQHYVKQLNERGVILAVCSKNERSTAESVFVEHPEMVLRLEDIALLVANWDDKAQNLMRIARDLNIGIDSLVFIDDNPAERARIRQSLPLVAVPELPQDPSGYVRCLAGSGYFESVTFTAEDQQRADQYSANIKRSQLQVSAESVDDYLKSLDMTMEASPFRDIDMMRVSQLINKTNQFNTTTRRRTLEERSSSIRPTSSTPRHDGGLLRKFVN